MSENTLNYQSPGLSQTQSLVRIGGSLGIAATSISLLIFTVGCFGFQKVFNGLPIIPLLLASVGMILTIVGATVRKAGDEDTQVFASMFVNMLGLIGALLELAIWLDWNMFYTT